MENQELKKRKREGRVARISARFLFCALLLTLGTFGAAPLAHAAFTMPQNNLGLVGWWTMDHITGTTVVDSSGSGNNGAEVNGPTQVAGKIGQALSFNGTNQYVTIGSSGFSNNSTTECVWANTTNLAQKNRQLVSIGGDNFGMLLSTDDSVGNQYVIKVVTASPVVQYTTSGFAMTSGQWSFICGVFDNSAHTNTLYANGKAISTVSTGTNLRGYTSNFIGSLDGTQNFFNGSIDDVRIYNRAFTAAEVQTLYQSSLPAHIASSINTPNLANGLVGWWTFDGNDLSGTSVFDKSGSGNTGTTVNSPKLIAGQIGQALSFNGTSQYVDVGSAASVRPQVFTISAWIKPSGSNIDGIFGGAGNGVGNIEFRVETNRTLGLIKQAVVAVGYSTGTVTNGAWQQVAVSYDSAGNYIFYINGLPAGSGNNLQTFAPSTDACIGKGYSTVEYFLGSIDDVRVYNRALSAAEVQSLYDLGKQSHIASTVNPSGLSAGLVGHWSFDGAHLTTTTAYDTSGQGNNGTLVNSPKPIAGVIGQALSFNGTSQYVTVGTLSPAITSPYTVSIWTNIPTLSLACLWDIGNKRLTTDESGTKWTIDSKGAGVISTSNSNVTLNSWVNVVFSYNGANSTWYINGKLDSSSAVNATNSGASVYIGKCSEGFPIKASIDDVRIYNRALSASEVQQLYGLGH